MIFSAQYLKDVNNIQSHMLYSIDEKNKEFSFEEQGSKHTINIKYELKEKLYGLFGNEYRSCQINKNCPDISKAVDLMCIIVDEQSKRTMTYLYDIKESFEGVDVIEKGLKQISASINHADSLMVYCKDFDNQKKMGIITGSFDEAKIKKFINEKKQILDERRNQNGKMPAMVLMNIATKDLKTEGQIKMLEGVLNRKVEILGTVFDLDILVSEKNDNTYLYNLHVSF